MAPRPPSRTRLLLVALVLLVACVATEGDGDASAVVSGAVVAEQDQPAGTPPDQPDTPPQEPPPPPIDDEPPAETSAAAEDEPAASLPEAVPIAPVVVDAGVRPPGGAPQQNAYSAIAAARMAMPPSPTLSGGNFDVNMTLDRAWRDNYGVWEPDDEDEDDSDRLSLTFDSVQVANTKRWRPRTVYQWLWPGFSNMDYLKNAYAGTGSMRGRRIYICHMDDGGHRRPVGVTFVEGEGAGTFQRCYFTFKNPTTGEVVFQQQELADGLWAVMWDNPRLSRGWYKWAPVEPVATSCMQLVGDPVARPFGTRCPRVTGNYAEENSALGFMPDRWICRWKEGDDWLLGWSDYDKRNPRSDNKCYAWRYGENDAKVPATRAAPNYQVLVHRRQDVIKQLATMPDVACGDGCRGQLDYPVGRWPGIAANDIVEGAMYYALNAASCCRRCRQTPGCIAWQYYTKGLMWCWLKYTDCFDQNFNGRIDPGECFTPPPPDPTREQCRAEFPRGETIGAVLPVSVRAKFSTGACKIQEGTLWDGRDLGFCGMPMRLAANNMAKCCEACQAFNRLQRDLGSSTRCYGWTFMKVYNICYLRDVETCNYSMGWDLPGTMVSALMDRSALFG